MMKNPEQEVAYFLFELKAFEYFVERSENHLVKDLEEYTQSLTSDDEALRLQFHCRRDLYADLKTQYPQSQRKSTFIMLFALLEDFLTQLSHCVKQHSGISISLTDSDGRGIDRAKEYLSRKTPFKFLAGTTEWNKIKKVQAIRNVFVHAAGYLDPNNHEKEIQIVQDDPHLDIEKAARNRIVMQSDYLLNVIQTLTSFGEMLRESAKELPEKNTEDTQKECPLYDHDYREDCRKLLIQGRNGWGPKEYCDETLRDLRNFLTIIDELISKREQSDVEEIEKHSSGPVAWEDEYPYWWEDIVQTQLRPAFIILLMSATEQHLKRLCSDTAYILQIERIKEKAKFAEYLTFLTKSAKFSEPPQMGRDRAIGLYHLRNTIAHDGGWITEEKKLNKIKSPLHKIEGIEFEEAGVPCLPTINVKFCFLAHQIVSDLFDHLHRQLEETAKRLSP